METKFLKMPHFPPSCQKGERSHGGGGSWKAPSTRKIKFPEPRDEWAGSTMEGKGCDTQIHS